jgi:hypothetical protein
MKSTMLAMAGMISLAGTTLFARDMQYNLMTVDSSPNFAVARGGIRISF